MQDWSSNTDTVDIVENTVLEYNWYSQIQLRNSAKQEHLWVQATNDLYRDYIGTPLHLLAQLLQIP